MDTQFTTTPMTTTPPEARSALRRCLIDRIGQELFHAEVLDGRTERSATWEGTTDNERETFRADARAALRRRDTVAAAVAMHKARQAARKALPAALLSELGQKTLDAVLEAAIVSHYAHLGYGKPDQEEREYERIVGFPAPREFRVIEGGRTVESAQQAEGHFFTNCDPGDEDASTSAEDARDHRAVGHPVECALSHESEL